MGSINQLFTLKHCLLVSICPGIKDLNQNSILNMASRAAQMLHTIKPHVPLIRFRKGAVLPASVEMPAIATPLAAQPVVQEAPVHVASQPSGQLKSAVRTHEWWDTPSKFRRRQIDQLEIDLINSGGSEKIYC